MSMAFVPISNQDNMTSRKSWFCSLFDKCFKNHRMKEAEERFNFEVKMLSYDSCRVYRLLEGSESC